MCKYNEKKWNGKGKPLFYFLPLFSAVHVYSKIVHP